MKLIYDQTEVVKKFLPKQSVDNSLKYREIFYIIKCAVEKGFLILNTVTYELIFLNTEEIKVLKCPNMNNSLEQYLAEHYFLVSQEFDDKKFANQVINTRLQIQNIYTNPKINTFVILPTTGCNARCFYCFEQGTKVSNMTEQTAHDVAKFIKKKGAGKVWLQWFGGEPLVNSKVIDIICADLTSNNIEYNSRMVSNGYLMDDKVLRKAVDLWRLKKIQITLDGTEDIYNRVKNYVYKDVSSPFVRVLNNIENILKAGIQTSIRLNMDVHNNNDLFELSKLLVERFNKFEN